jgi:hypothetical protein
MILGGYLVSTHRVSQGGGGGAAFETHGGFYIV